MSGSGGWKICRRPWPCILPTAAQDAADYSGYGRWAETVLIVVRERVAAAGLDQRDYSGHSLRAGSPLAALNPVCQPGGSKRRPATSHPLRGWWRESIAFAINVGDKSMEDIKRAISAGELPVEKQSLLGSLLQSDGTYVHQEGLYWDFKRE